MDEYPAFENFMQAGTPFATILRRLSLLSDRQLFNTKDGRFGFTIRGVRPGDLVCVFNNATTPHVLRKADDREGEVYRLVGDAYVHDLMHGEADEIDIEERDIILM